MNQLLQWLRARAKGESDAALSWDEESRQCYMHTYASNQYLEVIDFVVRHSHLFKEPPPENEPKPNQTREPSAQPDSQRLD